ncbi:MAG TPA: NAD(P)/FAD-dependent oxidoreductase [Solirubrobacteraceae bacterium]|nr:NAD(P)/FAD-dependent oxidoreductase [Solirubrobacteraceae bacterium]
MHRVVVVGGGFGGLQAAKHLKDAPVAVTLVDRRNFHLFQPLVYQVATGSLSPAEIAAPLRAMFKGQDNVDVVLGEVRDVDLAAREVTVATDLEDHEQLRLPYDTLIAAGGSSYSYFGHEDWKRFAPEIKSLESALMVRRRILLAFENADLEPHPEHRAPLLTFVIVGAGPTGVEMAGQIAEIARDTLPGDYRRIDPTQGRILLVETADRVLPGFPASLSAKAEQALRALGVTPLTGHAVTAIDADGVTVQAQGAQAESIAARTVIWAAGVTASTLAGKLAAAAGVETDRAGRVPVGADLTLPGHPEVFALGDMVVVDGKTLPGLAPVAMQEGRYAARAVRERLQGRTPRPFRYVDKGNLATIGRRRAVGDLKGVHLSGLPAWLTWLTVHLFYLVGFQNRLLVFIRWVVSFVTRGRGARLITYED